MLKKYILILTCAALIKTSETNPDLTLIIDAKITIGIENFKKLAPDMYRTYMKEDGRYEMRGTLALINTLHSQHAIEIYKYRHPQKIFFNNTNNSPIDLTRLDKK